MIDALVRCLARPTLRLALLMLVAASIVLARSGRAADGDAVLLGQENEANNATIIRAASGGPALHGVSSTDDGALVGESTALDGYGVRASGPYIGLNAVGGEIAAYAVSDYGKGVFALTYDGVAVNAATAVDAGTALQVDGRAAFKWSGRLTIPAGSKAATQLDVPLTANSMILATLQQRRGGVSIEAAVPDPAGRRFTIHLNKRVSEDTTVGWFVLN
jgi:hypothetical protein